jgi:hypothetical protein
MPVSEQKDVLRRAWDATDSAELTRHVQWTLCRLPTHAYKVCVRACSRVQTAAPRYYSAACDMLLIMYGYELERVLLCSQARSCPHACMQLTIDTQLGSVCGI